MQAAQVLAQQGGAMQLRYLQTLAAIATDKTTTIVFPLPVEMLRSFIGQAANEDKGR
jgi:hypothetical protein